MRALVLASAMLMAAACGDTESGSGGSGGAATGAGGMGGEPCLTCSQYRDACHPANGCPDKAELCDAGAVAALEALEECWCQPITCASVCSNTCQDNALNDPTSCFDCQQMQRSADCSSEWMTCVMF